MAGSEGFQALVEEIDRILGSPYPCQLKGLRDIVCKSCTNDDISQWVLSRPCQVQRLARLVLDTLRHWPYALDLLAGFSRSLFFRNAFLEAEPNLLRDILTAAVQAGDTSSKYSEIAVAMLAHPLTRSVALPIESQTLLVQLFNCAAEQPSLASIRPIYQMLQSSAGLLLGILSDNALIRLENQLFSIVRNLKGDDQSLSLYCLAIMKALAQASDEPVSDPVVSSYDTQELLASTEPSAIRKWNCGAVQQFFNEAKAQKTMQLVVLRVMWACTSTTNDSLDEKLDSLKLANEIITAVPSHEKCTWRNTNSLVLKKLEEKLNSPSLDIGLRFQALLFSIRFADKDGPYNDSLLGMRRLVLDVKDPRIAFENEQTDVIDDLILCGIFDAETTTAFLQNVLDFITSASPGTVAQRSRPVLSILERLHAACRWHEGITDGIMLALDVIACGSSLHSLLASCSHSTKLSSQPTSANLCTTAVQQHYCHLVHALCRVLVGASLASSNSSYCIPQDTLSLLLDLHGKSAQLAIDCQHVKAPHAASRKRTFVELECTPNEFNSDWRDTLQIELTAQADSHRNRLEAMFVKACSDLEDRCNNAEQPWKREQQRLVDLTAKYDELKAAHAALEIENVDLKVQFDAVEAERDQNTADLLVVRSENGDLLSRVEELQQALRDATYRAERSLEQGQHALQKVELAQAAVLATKEEELEDLQARAHDLLNQLEEKARDTSKIQTELDATKVTLQAAEAAISQQEQSMADRKQAVETLTLERTVMESDVQELQARNASLAAQVNDLEVAHKSALLKMEEETSQNLALQKAELEAQLTSVSNEHARLVDELGLKLDEVENHALNSREQHAIELQQRDRELEDARQKLERFQRKYEQKAQQLASATAMQANIAAAMGLTAVDPQNSVTRRTTRSSMAHAPYHEEDGETQDPSPPTPFSSDDFETQQQQQQQQQHQRRRRNQSTAHNLLSSLDDAQSDPTPKRRRSRKAFKIPSPAKAQERTGTASRSTRTSLRVQNTGKRRPLIDVGANYQTSAAISTSGKGAQLLEVEKHEIGPDDTTWDGSEIFTGTMGR